MGGIILFICTGNTCRSPMAEALLRVAAERQGKRIPVMSAGLSVALDSPAHELAIQAVAELGGDLSDHCTRPFTLGYCAAAGATYCMTKKHRDYLIRKLPQYSDRIKLLCDEEVPDPFGGKLEKYRKTAAQIQKAVEAIVRDYRKSLS